MKKRYTLSIIVILALLSACKFDNRGCLVPWDTEGTGYLFEIPVSIRPLKSKLHVGDTLMLQIRMSDTISDLREPGKDKHLLENFPLYIVPRIERLSDDLQHAHDFFDYYNSGYADIITLKGTCQKESETHPRDSKYCCIYKAPYYELQLAIVPKQAGIYVISFSSNYYPKGCLPWLCTYQSVTARIKVNHSNDNFALLQRSTQNTPWHVSRTDRGTGYAIQYTILHDSLPNYRPERLLLVDYCFEVLPKDDPISDHHNNLHKSK